MGTRSLTAVQQGGTYKIAQYGQFDGYPSAAGATILDFLATWDRPSFEQKLDLISFNTPDYIERINAQIVEQGLVNTWPQKWPELHRETGAKILAIVANSPNPEALRLTNNLPFAGDSLMCEWAYVIDLDANTFEVFKGFNKTPLTPQDRFHHIHDPESSAGYFPVRKIASYPLDALPTVEAIEAAAK